MRHKLKLSFWLIFLGTMMLAEGSSSRCDAASATNKMPALAISIVVNKEKIQGGERIIARINRSGDTSEQVAIRLESTQPSIIVVPKSDVILARGESSVPFELLSVSTPIKATVTIKAYLSSNLIPAIRTIEVYPAILKTVTLSAATLNGTHGSKINCRVELNANAPTGGIELHLDLFGASVRGNLRLDIPNPRVAAGNKEGTFEIAYDKIYSGEEQVSRDRTDFNTQTRTLDLVVSLESQTIKPWQSIPEIAGKVTFDVIPLRVSSISVQPASVTGGAESLASFTLNFPAGTNEKVRLSPVRTASSSNAWARALGSSCQASVQQPLEMPLTQGVATHSFKVCTASVTTATTGTLYVSTRSENVPVHITIQP
ncbi:MAG: hypothetical protein ABR568_06200 [Pyrinomonadaceae bacterium]